MCVIDRVTSRKNVDSVRAEYWGGGRKNMGAGKTEAKRIGCEGVRKIFGG